MSVECFTAACQAVAAFPSESEPCPHGRIKVIGIIGGEPLLHPEFPRLVDILCEHVPEARHRGLWTGIDFQTHQQRAAVEKLLGGKGYLNQNLHLPRMKVQHQPILTASVDLVPDYRRRWELIEACWVQNLWAAAITPKGYFFCEVAAALDTIFEGPGGLPIDLDCWRGDLWFEADAMGVRQPHGPYAEQILRWCERCGACVPLPGRLDSEEIDDVSPANLAELERLGSPRIERGSYKLWADPLVEGFGGQWRPQKYIRGTRQ